jgi:type II secretory pathway component PulJ
MVNASLDRSRRLIGFTLLALLTAIVLGGFAMLMWIEAESARALLQGAQTAGDVERLAAVARIAAEQSKANAERLALVLNIVFGPVAALVGSVTGFYFGSRRG